MAAPTRWGILGAGKIANDYCLCISSLPDDEHKIVAVAARSKDKAEEFAQRFNIPQAHALYKELMENPDVDVIYVSTIHPTHVELSLACIAAGKNVVCEKPMAMSMEGCKKVLKAAQEKGVFFLEGYWTRFFPVMNFIREQIASGNLGEVRSVQANFCSAIAAVPRLARKELGGGGLWDIGCYTIQVANSVFGGRPEKIIAEGKVNEDGVDRGATIIMRFPDNKIATLIYDTETEKGGNSFIVRGTKGNLVVPDYMWCPDRVLEQSGNVKFFQLPSFDKDDQLNFYHSQGFCYEIQAVRECLLNGKKESALMNHEMSDTIMYVLTEVQRLLGLQHEHQ